MVLVTGACKNLCRILPTLRLSVSLSVRPNIRVAFSTRPEFILSLSLLLFFFFCHWGFFFLTVPGWLASWVGERAADVVLGGSGRMADDFPPLPRPVCPSISLFVCPRVRLCSKPFLAYFTSQP